MNFPCDVNGDGLCNNNDATTIGRAVIGLAPAVQQTCTAAVCHAPEVMNAVTCPILP